MTTKTKVSVSARSCHVRMTVGNQSFDKSGDASIVFAELQEFIQSAAAIELMPEGRRTKSRKARIAWLREHPELWGKSDTEIVGEMKLAGVLSLKQAKSIAEYRNG